MGKSFDEMVYSACKRIPKGKVATYAEIARAIGNPKASRAVGNSLNRNPALIMVPCHRVVRSDGNVGGFARGTNDKIELLSKEDVIVIDKKVNLEKYKCDL